MYTRRDQLQAYRFVTRRMVSALLSGEPEATERPMRRYGLGVFSSVMLAAIVFAGVGVYGLIKPAAAKLPDPAIVIQQETGARYVFVGGELHPVLNFASARLLLGAADPQVVRASARSLGGYARGPAVGIANLPDPLPDRAAITAGPWSACSLRRSTGSAEFVTHLVIGKPLPGGQPLGANGLLVAEFGAAGETDWLITDGRRLRVPENALAPLGLVTAKPVPITNGVLDGIPPGPDLALPTVDSLFAAGQPVDGQATTVGQLFLAAGQHYIMLRTGLATVGPVMLKLLTALNSNVTTIPPGAATAARSTVTPAFDPPGFPTAMPALVYPQSEPATVCFVAGPPPSTPDTSATAVMLYDQLGPLGGIDPTPPRFGLDGVRLADHVEIAGSQASIVRTLAAPGDTTGNTTTYLVTDEGVRYALPREDTATVLASLGYGGIAPMPVPTFLLALLPLGPTLDPAAARQFIVNGVTPSPVPTATASGG